MLPSYAFKNNKQEPEKQNFKEENCVEKIKQEYKEDRISRL